MQITDDSALPTSYAFLEGMKWRAYESWFEPNNDPDRHKERMIDISSVIEDMTIGSCICPREYDQLLQGNDFDPLRGDPDFEKLCERVKALIVMK